MKKIYSKKKKKNMKIIVRNGLGLFFSILLVFNVHFVDAGMNDSKLLKNRVDDIYAVTNLNGDVHLYYLDMYTMNGRISYCIDLGKKVTTDLYHSTNDFSISYLSQDQIDYIQSISYFGYQYPGHEDNRFYMAAQEIIWEYLSGAEVEWTKVLDVHGDRMDIEAFKEEILMLRNQFYKELYFGGFGELTVQAGDRIYLSDYSGSLGFYEVSFYQNSEVKIDGNIVFIQTDADYVGRSNIILSTKDVYTYESQLYYYENSQRLISNGNIERREKHFWFSTTGNNIHFQLVDGDSKVNHPQGQASLKGAIYELYNQKGEMIETFSTDEFGRAEVRNLVRGNYFIRQIEASLGYFLNPLEIEFEVDSKDLDITLEEYVITNTIELMKFYGIDGDEKIFLEENIEFLITDEFGNEFDTIYTNELGSASILLPYGKYLFQQMNTTYGYSKVDDFEVVVDQQMDNSRKYQLFDSLIEVKVRLISVLEESQEEIPSSGFSYRIKDEKTSEYLEYEGQTIFSTDESGQLIFPKKLSYGDYVLEQVCVPKGYILHSEEIPFSIHESSDLEWIDGELIMNLIIDYSLILGKINVITNEEVFHSYLNGYDYQKQIRDHVELSLIAQEDIGVLGEVLVQVGEEVESITTDEQGKVTLDHLYLGKYCLFEKESGLKYCFSLEDFSQEDFVVEKDIELTMVIEKTDFILKNVSDVEEEIEGAIFELYNQNRELIYTGITDEEGIMKVLDLPKGEYCILQKEVPSLYLTSLDEVCFQISDMKKDYQLNFINQRDSKRLILVPNTLSNQQDIFKFFLLSAFIFGIGVVFYKKIFCSSRN